MTLLLFATSAFTAGPEVLNNYYSDDTFTTAVAWTDNDYCTDTYSEFGTRTNYRYTEVINCGTGNDTYAACQVYEAGTGSWVNVTCPNQTLTTQGRLRIPVGQQ